MKAMIFAAGLGTRLSPFTNDKPKALVPYNGIPLLQIVIQNLAKQGINEFIINIHHFASKVKNFLAENNNFNQTVTISDETDLLLETGGGLQKVANLLDDSPFLVHNVDILSDINIKQLINKHLKNNALATLAVQNRKSSKKLYFNKTDGFLCKWKNEKTNQEKHARKCENPIPFAFSGIHVIDPKIFEYMKPGVYSIIDTYLTAAKFEKITFFDHSNTFWRDMGKPESFDK